MPLLGGSRLVKGGAGGAVAAIPGGQAPAAINVPLIPQLVADASVAPVAAPSTTGAVQVQYDAGGSVYLWVYASAAWKGVEVIA